MVGKQGLSSRNIFEYETPHFLILMIFFAPIYGGNVSFLCYGILKNMVPDGNLFIKGDIDNIQIQNQCSVSHF